MSVRIGVLLLLFSCFVAGVFRTTRGAASQKSDLPPVYVPSGRQFYKDYCAACHGSDGKGHGPVTRSLRKAPPDLTTLAKRHGGKFPEEYVPSVLRFGFGFSAYGSSEMPYGDRSSSTRNTTTRQRFASGSRTYANTSNPFSATSSSRMTDERMPT
jgi:hypothetical protein